MSTQKENEDKGIIDWHSGFEGSLRLILREYKGFIDITREYPLSMEPLKMDFLVLKNDTGVYIDNAVGRGFLKHNIIEYKSPDDELNIDVIWKTIGYAGIYKSLGNTVNEIKAEELTITIFRVRKPVALFKLLDHNGYIVENEEPGVYQIHGIVSIPLRIVVIRELEDDKLSAMKIMKRNAKPLDIEKFLQEAKDYEDLEDKRSADAVLQVSANVNKELYERLRGDEKMCEALKEIMAEDLKKAEAQGVEKINKLILVLTEEKRYDDLARAAQEPSYQAQLIRELVDPNYKG
nr:hypothetical protein [uncultured Butyrivibrio sp.]